ncbi:hypothetical protein [uncultured Sulfitobacter sp.]|uniref:hypothetical protein n=1 Tax=uncultured Sulfitobacter sp. TaxID=191468 RepID=UPI0030FAE7DC
MVLVLANLPLQGMPVCDFIEELSSRTETTFPVSILRSRLQLTQKDWAFFKLAAVNAGRSIDRNGLILLKKSLDLTLRVELLR